jgi:hypothetical protein
MNCTTEVPFLCGPRRFWGTITFGGAEELPIESLTIVWFAASPRWCCGLASSRVVEIPPQPGPWPSSEIFPFGLFKASKGLARLSVNAQNGNPGFVPYPPRLDLFRGSGEGFD